MPSRRAFQSLSCRAECAVLAGVKKKGGEFGGFAEILDPADENGVVAAGVGGFVGDFEGRAASGENRGAAAAGLPGQADETVGRPGGETVGEVLLVDRQDVDGVMAGLAKGGEIVRAVVQAPEHQRRLQRHRREGIDGQADRMTVRVDGRDDGDAGREAAQGIAQGAGVGLRCGHGSQRGQNAVLSRLPPAASRRNLPKEQAFAQRLIDWQRAAGRHGLPWQGSRDPYRVWLSEIMLQQTQVSTVIPYYQRFLGRFPNVATLAAAPIEAVIEHWAGLGYYARARNLHRCAQHIVTVHAGNFPKSAAQLAELPGIGRSTAAAIAAFSFGERAAILDGNVKRVLCRIFAIEGFPGSAAVDRKLWQLAESLLPERDLASYTQGLMDLGATICTRQAPICERCPYNDECLARRDGRQGELPTPRPRATVPERHSHFLFITDGQHIVLERRPPQGLWGGLLVPPEGDPDVVLARLGLHGTALETLASLRHAFTHFRLTLQPVLCRVPTLTTLSEPTLVCLPLAAAASAGVPTPIGKLLKQVASAVG